MTFFTSLKAQFATVGQLSSAQYTMYKAVFLIALIFGDQVAYTSAMSTTANVLSAHDRIHEIDNILSEMTQLKAQLESSQTINVPSWATKLANDDAAQAAFKSYYSQAMENPQFSKHMSYLQNNPEKIGSILSIVPESLIDTAITLIQMDGQSAFGKALATSKTSDFDIETLLQVPPGLCGGTNCFNQGTCDAGTQQCTCYVDAGIGAFIGHDCQFYACDAKNLTSFNDASKGHAVTCAAPANRTSESIPPYYAGTECTFTCGSGYHITGQQGVQSKSSSCQMHVGWAAGIPSCEQDPTPPPGTCGAPSVPAGATSSCGASSNVGSSCTVTCPTGQFVTGSPSVATVSKTITCNGGATNTWSGSLECTAKTACGSGTLNADNTCDCGKFHSGAECGDLNGLAVVLIVIAVVVVVGSAAAAAIVRHRRRAQRTGGDDEEDDDVQPGVLAPTTPRTDGTGSLSSPRTATVGTDDGF